MMRDEPAALGNRLNHDERALRLSLHNEARLPEPKIARDAF